MSRSYCPVADGRWPTAAGRSYVDRYRITGGVGTRAGVPIGASVHSRVVSRKRRLDSIDWRLGERLEPSPTRTVPRVTTPIGVRASIPRRSQRLARERRSLRMCVVSHVPDHDAIRRRWASRAGARVRVPLERVGVVESKLVCGPIHNRGQSVDRSDSEPGGSNRRFGWNRRVYQHARTRIDGRGESLPTARLSRGYTRDYDGAVYRDEVGVQQSGGSVGAVHAVPIPSSRITCAKLSR